MRRVAPPTACIARAAIACKLNSMKDVSTARDAMVLVRDRIEPWWGEAAFARVLEMAARVPRSVSSHFGVEAHLQDPHGLDFGFSLTHPTLIASPEIAEALEVDPAALGEIASMITAQRPGLRSPVRDAWVELDTSRGRALAGLGGRLDDEDQTDPTAVVAFLEAIGGPLDEAPRTAIARLLDPRHGVRVSQVGTFVGRDGAPARLIVAAPDPAELDRALLGAGWDPGALAEVRSLGGDAIGFSAVAVDVLPGVGPTPRVGVEIYSPADRIAEIAERIVSLAGADAEHTAAALAFTGAFGIDALAVARTRLHHFKVDVAPHGISTPKAYLSLRIVLAPRAFVQGLESA